MPGPPDPTVDRLVDPPAWAPSWLPTAGDVRRRRYLRWAANGVLALGLASCVLRSADQPADPELGTLTTGDSSGTSAPAGDGDGAGPVVADPGGTTPDTADPGTSGSPGSTGDDRSLADQFGTVLVQLAVASTGRTVELCMFDADQAAERSRGLMEVTDFEDHDGMVFRFDGDSTGQFFMLNTPTPLSISWWAADGAFVSGTDMEPCLDTPAGECTRYGATGPYRFAVEVPQGALGSTDVLAGARLTIGDAGCTPT